MQEFEEQPCFICGETGHRQWECPNGKDDTYKLPEHLKAAVDATYARDIARREVKSQTRPLAALSCTLSHNLPQHLNAVVQAICSCGMSRSMRRPTRAVFCRFLCSQKRRRKRWITQNRW